MDGGMVDMESPVLPFDKDSESGVTDETTKGRHGRLFVIVYARGSRFDLATRGWTPGDRLAINSAAAGLVNLTTATPFVDRFNTTTMARESEDDEI